MTNANTLTKQIDKHVSQLREVGWCVVEGVIPESEVDAHSPVCGNRPSGGDR